MRRDAMLVSHSRIVQNKIIQNGIVQNETQALRLYI